MHPVLAEIRPPTVTRGRIVTCLPLDREETDSYSLYVIAMDSSGNPLNATATVAIEVLDTNDNVPEFSASNFTFEVPENAEQDILIMEFNVSATEYTQLAWFSALHGLNSTCEKVTVKLVGGLGMQLWIEQ